MKIAIAMLMPTRNVSRNLLLCGLLTAGAIAGCGSESGLERVEVRGNVTYAGQPVENGEIRFFPIQTTEGPVSGAPIVDGQYRVTHRGGVPVGNHRIQVEAFRPSQAYPELNAEGGHREQFLPLKYNVKSKLTVTVPGNENVFVHDLDLSK